MLKREVPGCCQHLLWRRWRRHEEDDLMDELCLLSVPLPAAVSRRGRPFPWMRMGQTISWRLGSSEMLRLKPLN
jgi:hypothetical protein